MTLLKNDLWEWSALANAISAMIVFWFMVRLTHGAGFKCRMALLRLFQRFALFVLAIFLAFDSALTVQNAENPRPIDAALQLAFMIALVISATRSLCAPDIPSGANWNRPMKISAHL